jgi:anti-sigma B factor antagonist
VYGVPGGDDQPASEVELLTTHVVDAAAALVLHVWGDIDDYTAPLLGAALDDAAARAGSRPVVVDLSAVSFIGSAGIAVLVGAVPPSPNRLAVPLQVVTGNNPVVSHPFAALGVDRVVPLYPGLDDALAAVIATRPGPHPSPGADW